MDWFYWTTCMYKHMKLYTQRHAYFIWEIPMPATS